MYKKEITYARYEGKNKPLRVLTAKFIFPSWDKGNEKTVLKRALGMNLIFIKGI